MQFISWADVIVAYAIIAILNPLHAAPVVIFTQDTVHVAIEDD